MSRTGAKWAGRRFYRRPACLLALGLVSSLGATYALAAVVVSVGHSASVAPQPLSIHTEPLSRTVAPGGSAQFAVRVTRRPHAAAVGLSGRTDLSVRSELPAGAGVSFTPQRSLASPGASPRSSTLTLTTAADTPAGTYTLRVQAHRPHRAGATTISLTVSSPANAVAAAVPKPTTPTVPVATPDAFTISGTLPDPLAPGAEEPLDLSLANRESTDLSISSLSVQVASLSGPQSDPAHPCRANDFSVEQFSGAPGFTLPASSTASLSELGFAPAEWPKVSMLDLPVNQDGCKQASLTLSFAGSATEATP